MFRTIMYKDPYTYTTVITFVKEIDGKCYYAEPVELKFKHIPYGEQVSPTLRVVDLDTTGFLKSIYDAIKSTNIVKEPIAVPSVSERHLKSVEYHLEDLRQLLKLNKS